jgi:hypothetical protein
MAVIERHQRLSGCKLSTPSMRRPVSVKPFLSFPFFFYSPSFSRRNFTPGSPGIDDRQLGRSTASPVLTLPSKGR